MNKTMKMAVATALAMGASAAQAGIIIPAGDWNIDIGGNLNAYYTNTKSSGTKIGGAAVTGATANTVGTGLLPSALGVGGKTRQNDLDIAFQFTFFTGSSSGANQAGGSNTLNIRQAYMTFGDKSWGTIKAGRDLGIFGSDAILSDMTLLGVGVGGPAGGSSTLGRIGSGYVYADWVGQIQYASPNWNGFSFAAAIREPWSNGATGETRHDMGFDGKVSYEWAGDFAGKVWLGGLTEKHQVSTDPTATGGYTSNGGEIGGKVGYSGAELVGYYYDGEGLDSQMTQSGATFTQTTGGLMFLAGQKTKDSGGYVQGTFKIPGAGTKLGISWGENNSKSQDGTAEIQNKSWIFGAYHPLTKSLNLVAEYTDQKIDGSGSAAGLNQLNIKDRTISLGAIMFF
jgi:predicted porin